MLGWVSYSLNHTKLHVSDYLSQESLETSKIFTMNPLYSTARRCYEQLGSDKYEISYPTVFINFDLMLSTANVRQKKQ